MIIKCVTQNDVKIVIDYIGNDYQESLYLYLDAKKYGIKNQNVMCWLQQYEGKITAVILMYHTGMHIYSREKVFNAEEIVDLINVRKPSMICAEATIIKKLSQNLKEYKMELGYVARFFGNEENVYIDAIKHACPSDYKEMAKMLISDEIGNSYSLDELEKQIAERIEDGYSRSYCMFVGEKMVAQASTGAEESGIATIAYVITEQTSRGKGYGGVIVKYLCNELVKEGLEVYLIYYSEKAGRLYLKNGFENVCEYGKLYQVL